MIELIGEILTIAALFVGVLFVIAAMAFLFIGAGDPTIFILSAIMFFALSAVLILSEISTKVGT